MSQERLEGLAMLSIDQGLAKQINFDDVIEQLAIQKVVGNKQ